MQLNTKEDYIAFIESNDVELFVGKNYRKYVTHWTKGVMQTKDLSKGVHIASFNLMALLFMPAWFGYRKLHSFFWAYTGILCASTFIEYMTGFYLPNSAYLGGAIALSMYMNGFYLTHIKKFFEKFPDNPNQDREALIKKAGGTSVGLAFGYGFLSLALIIASAVLSSFIAQSLGIAVPEDRAFF